MSTHTHSQQKFTVHVGVSIPLTDVAGNPGEGKWFIKDANTRCLGFYVGVSKALGDFDVGINFIQLHDADTNVPRRGGAEEWRYIRKFYFQTNLVELSITKSIELWQTISVSTGASIFFLPRYDSTERSVARLQPAVIFQGSIGSTWKLNIAYRKLFTDYLDGYSLRADPKDNDAFFTVGMSYTFSKKKINQMKCYRL